MNISAIVAVVCVLSCLLALGCNTSDPTSAVLANEYMPSGDGGTAKSMTVFKGWWAVAQFPDPVAAGRISDPVRVVQGTDYGYALLAPGWDPAGGTTPTTLIPLRSAQKLSVSRGDTLNFVVSDDAAVGDCAAGKPLAQEDADFITQRIFPGEFANLTYDAALCTSSSGTGGGDASNGNEAGAGGEGGSP